LIDFTGFQVLNMILYFLCILTCKISNFTSQNSFLTTMKVAIKRELRQKTIGTPSHKQLDMHLIAKEIAQNLNVGWG